MCVAVVMTHKVWDDHGGWSERAVRLAQYIEFDLAISEARLALSCGIGPSPWPIHCLIHGPVFLYLHSRFGIVPLFISKALEHFPFICFHLFRLPLVCISSPSLYVRSPEFMYHPSCMQVETGSLNRHNSLSQILL